ncbi:MAG: (d)CMP kinase, partial [Gemmatimonadota bacterium]
AGSGKSTTAKAVAVRLGFLHLDSGALYRAFAVAARERSLTSADGVVDAAAIAALAEEQVGATVRGGAMEVTLDGRPLGAELRTPLVTACASRISAFREIRDRVNALLRLLASDYEGGIVCEGRDMGTVVFPAAELKVFMVADSEERARRRLRQRGDPVTPENLEGEADRLLARDKQDSERDESPLRKARGAMVVDTTRLRFEEQVERIVAAARRLLDTRGKNRLN